MLEDHPPRRHGLEVALIFGGWTLYGLLSGIQTRFMLAVRGHPSPWSNALVVGLLEGLLWALATLVIFRLARRWPLERERLLARVPIHVLAAVALAVLRALILAELTNHIGWMGQRSFSRQFLASFHISFLFYWLPLGLAHAVDYHARMREREQAAERLTAGLTAARLQALKMQLHPHFLFNTLHAISALIPPEAKSARRMVARLGEILRSTLEHEETQEVSLREELAFLEPYLEIEQARLGDRLTVSFELQPDALEARVPHLVLQPLVENAIRHGISPRLGAGSIQIAASRSPDGRFLELEVRDDGLGLRNGEAATRVAPEAAAQWIGDAAEEQGEGVGLSNVRYRLEQLYGRQQSIEVRDRPGGGVVVRLAVPYRTVAEPRRPEERESP